MKLIQEWHGEVLSVHKKYFRALLTDKTNESNPMEEMNIYFDEILKNDYGKVVEGMTFKWKIYEKNNNAISEIVFDDIPIWTIEELNEVKRLAKEFMKYFGDIK
jgi:hypothetical protein